MIPPTGLERHIDQQWTEGSMNANFNSLRAPMQQGSGIFYPLHEKESAQAEKNSPECDEFKVITSPTSTTSSGDGRNSSGRDSVKTPQRETLAKEI